MLTFELLTGQSPFTKEGNNSRNQPADIQRRILRNEPVIPQQFHRYTRDFILQLLIKDPSRRLGGGPRDADELKEHPFFTKTPPPFSWHALERKEVTPPLVPQVDHPNDTRNFSDEFTTLDPKLEMDSPAVVPPHCRDIFRVSFHTFFKSSFSWVKRKINEKILNFRGTRTSRRK